MPPVTRRSLAKPDARHPRWAPSGGAAGGHIVAEGTPEAIMAHPTSYTGQFLTRHMVRHGRTASVGT